MTAFETIHGTIEENFELALKEEEIMRQCGTFDPYYRIAKNNVEYYFACAAALERGETKIPVKMSYLRK